MSLNNFLRTAQRGARFISHYLWSWGARKLSAGIDHVTILMMLMLMMVVVMMMVVMVVVMVMKVMMMFWLEFVGQVGI